MFLALREIRYNKARYTLIGAIIFFNCLCSLYTVRTICRTCQSI